MTCSTDQFHPYTILFQRLEEARSAQGEAQRKANDRVMEEGDRIQTVRELAEAAADVTEFVTYTRT